LKKAIAKKINFPQSPITVILCLYFVFVFISPFYSGYPRESWKGFSRVPKYIFLFFALLELFGDDQKRIKRFFWAIIIVSTVTFLNGIFQNIFGFELFKHHVINKLDYFRRIQSSFADPNDFGAYIISILPLTFLFLTPTLPKIKRLLLLGVCLLGFYCLLKTSSRGAWVGLLAGISIYSFIYNKKIAVIIPLAVICLLMVTPHGFQRVTALFKSEKNTVWEREVLWKTTWKMIKEHPVVGRGVNTYSRNFPKYKPSDYPDLRYAHNSYLQMWSEIGIIGLLLFLSIPAVILVKALSAIKLKIKQHPEGLILLGLIAGYIGLLTHSIFDNNLFSLVLTTLFWVFSASIVAINKMLGQKLYAKR
jgi:O-antigen ligase